MDELFGNLIYLLPIALIVVRIISAAGNSKKKRPPSGPARPDETVRPGKTARPDETPRRAPVEDMDPAMREFLERFGVKPPPAAPKPAPVRKRAVKEKPQKKEPVKTQDVSFFDTDTQKQAEQAGDLRESAAAEQRGVKLPAGLSPLQQGLLWAEILGPAKAMQD